MFEGIVSDLLNRVLGTYIENLDCSKLKISIWGGDVELKDLIIKQSALDELQLPVRPVFGYLKRLCLKIPWSKLYTERWEAVVEGLALVVVPNSSITYDSQKEEQLQHETKLATLARIEEAKQRSKIKALGKETKAQDGFMEKLIAQVIRNIQVQIKNIHVRYEDSVTSPLRPFALGVALQNFSLQSTDANWKVGLDTAKLIYKLLTLEGFQLYWSPNASLLSHSGKNNEEMRDILIELSSGDYPGYSLKPVLGPLNLTAKLQLNPRPEIDENPFSVPKAALDIVLMKLSIAMSRYQYEGMMSLLDSLDSMNLASAFRKYRPNVDSIKGNTKLWWKYAYNCKLENIRRIRRNWSWSRMKEHRERCKRYKELYKQKLSGAKLNQAQKDELDSMEKVLDVFNITLVRKQAEMEQEREGLLKAETQQKKGWFGGWLSWGSQEQANIEEGTDIVKQLQAEMNSDEKQKMYEAIGYSEEGVRSEMPVDYVDLRLQFLLEELEVRVLDEVLGNNTVCVASTRKVICKLTTRSAASAISVESSMQSFDVAGLRQNGAVTDQPLLVESLCVSEEVPLLDILLETNPLDAKCDTRLRLVAQPLNICYHSATVAQVADLFAPPKNVSLQQLQAAALTQLEVVKERSSAGLQVAIDNHSILDLNISIRSSRLILPELGYFKEDSSMIVVNLGSVSIESKPRSNQKPSLTQWASTDSDKSEILELMRSSSYDCFNIHLKDIQVVVAEKGEDWQLALASTEESSLHLLRPLTLKVEVYKCLITSDPNLPKIKVDATLPEIALSIIDKKVIQAAVIANNCFSPDATTPVYSQEGGTLREDIDLNQNVISDDVALVRLEKGTINPDGECQPTPQFTEVVINFTIMEMVIEILKADCEEESCISLMKITAKELGLKIVQKTFDLNIDVSLSQITADHLEWGCQPIIRTHPDTNSSSHSLLNIHIRQVNPKSPDIYTLHKSINQYIDIEMARLTARLEQAALLSLLAFASNLQRSLDEVTPQSDRRSADRLRRESQKTRKKSMKESIKGSIRGKKDHIHASHIKKKEEPSKKEAFQQKFSAKLSQVELSVSRHDHDLVRLMVIGLSVDVLMQGQDTEIISVLEQFALVDPDPLALHSKIVAMEGGHAWNAQINLYGDQSNDLNFFDVDKFDVGIKLELGTPKIVFLNKTVVDVLSWVDNFQVAKEAVVNASQAAAKAAKENLSEAYSHGSKIKLDLVLQAPVIFIPHSSSSSQGILLDLGKILIRNKVELGDARNELGHPCVFDKLGLEVQNVKISRKQSFNDSKETHLLEPFCLEVSLVRNLSISWYKVLPETEINARLKALQMRLSEDDMSSVLAILQGNLGETPDEDAQPESNISETQVLTERKREALADSQREQILDEHGKLYKKVSLHFVIDDVALTLFTSNAEADTSHCEGLAKFALKGLTLKTDVFSDMTLGANFILYDCLLQDIRKDYQEGITVMMEKKPDSTERSLQGAMIDLTFHQGKRKDIFVDLKISKFVLILHLPFLLQIQKFFAIEAPKDMTEEEMHREATQAVAEMVLEDKVSKEHSRRSVKRKEKVENKQKLATTASESEYDSVITVYIKVEEPDIVLVEDLSNIDTSCIFLHTEVKCSVKMSASQRNITANMSNVQMYTSVFNPSKRIDCLSQILMKSDISFLCSATSTHADNIQIKLGTLNFRLAPDTVELVMNIVGCLSTGEEVSTQIKPLELKDWSDLWMPQNIDFQSIPHLNIDSAEEAAMEVSICPLSPASTEGAEAAPLGGEALYVELECLLVTLEAGSGTLSIPLIKLQSECNICADGFYSSQMSLNGTLTFEMAYYNTRQAIWEPLLEPVEKMNPHDSSMQYQPWTLNFEGHMIMGSQPSQASESSTLRNPSPPLVSPTEDFDIIDYEPPPPLTKLSLTAHDPLEFTVTKTLLEVLGVLSDSFMAAYTKSLSVRKLPKAPYRLINKTGLSIAVNLKESGLKISSSGENDIEQLLVEADGEVDLFEWTSRAYTHRRHSSLVAQCQIATEKLINIKIVSVGADCAVPVTKADKRYFSITPKGKLKEKLGLVTSVSVEGGCKVITLSGCVKVTNELDTAVDVYYMTEGGNEVEFVCALEPKDNTLLPLHAVYTPTSELFFSVKGYSVCINPLIWKRLQNFPNLSQELHCQPRTQPTKNAVKMPFMFCANCEVEQIFWANTSRRPLDSVMIDVYLRPCLILNNLLPVAISLFAPGESQKKVLVPGASLHINHAQLGAIYLEIEIYDYQGNDWKCGKSIEAQPPELSVWTFKKIAVESEATLDLGLHITKVKGVHQMSIYCPFWMVNKTGMDLTYKTDSLVHSIEHKKNSRDVVLFSFRSKAFFGKKKACIRLPDSEWSEKFPLDTVGSAAAVACKSSSNKSLIYQISIDIQLSGSGLTKIVTFSPFYKVINRCPYSLQFFLEEDQLGTWHPLASGNCIGIWPPGETKALKLKVDGTNDKTEPIHFDASHTTLFKLRNKFGGVFVEVSQTEGATLISLDKCLEGATTALILNHLRSSSLAFWQEGHEDKKIELDSQKMIHFTWDSAESRRLLVFSCMGCPPVTIALNADGKGSIDGDDAGWSTWMAGAQRYVVVSADQEMLSVPPPSNHMERVQQELEVTFASIGVSLVNDVIQQEIMYLCMASSGIVWEHRKEKGKKFRPFTEEQTHLLEKVYAIYSAETKGSKENVKSHFLLKPQFEVDFCLMKVLKPFDRHIRRVFQPGIWTRMQVKTSERNFHLKVNKVQLDNQISSDVMFPVVMARVPPPKGVMAETVPKPFFEMSVMMSVDSPIFTRYTYMALLIQEFHLKVELPFIYAILQALFSEQNVDVIYSPDKYEKDYAVVRQDLVSMVASQKKPSRRDFYHYIHLSPIKMHLSFSLTGLDSASDVPIGGQVIHLFLQSVGVTLTEVQDVIFRLGFFERKDCWLNIEGLQDEVISHYTNQVVKQLYVLVLGLDVIGNPFGLVLGVTKGFGDLFYEPIQGAVEGPGEFAEGLFYGMRSFMGKTVGGAAGAFSRITGTIGKGVASLTLDDDYQRRRREEMHKKPTDGLESFARGGRGVLTGVVDGVTGVFTKPISGAKEEGVEGFFKGMGKGVVGLVTRPASGMIDFASGSFEAVMRATDSSEDVTPVRPPRFIKIDGVIRPYQHRQAAGVKLLKELEKGRYSETDAYVTHAVTKGEKGILLASDKRIFLVSRNDLLGQWKIEWIHMYEELAEPPILAPSGIKLTVKQAKKKVLGVFGGGSNSKEVCLHDPNDNKMVLNEICEAYVKAHQK